LTGGANPFSFVSHPIGGARSQESSHLPTNVTRTGAQSSLGLLAPPLTIASVMGQSAANLAPRRLTELGERSTHLHVTCCRLLAGFRTTRCRLVNEFRNEMTVCRNVADACLAE
jgi:hypothetical protein